MIPPVPAFAAALGFAIVDDLLALDLLPELARTCDELLAGGPGRRDGLRHPLLRELAASRAVRAVVEPVPGPTCFAHRATVFDKTPAANWPVPWHQDLMVPVAARVDAAGFGPWSQKHGTWWVQPPAATLANLLAVRIDLDGSRPETGCLRVLPGTHLAGVLPPVRIAELQAQVAPVWCAAPAGGAVLMRPLLLHASSRATVAGHRRVVHLEFAAAPLAGGVDWLDRVPAR